MKLIDTAGIRQTDEVVEQIGVEKSRAVMEKADLIILVLNQSEALQTVDIELLKATKDQNRIILMNKQDLSPVLTRHTLAPYGVSEDELITTSMLNESGLDLLEQQIEQKFFSGNIQSGDINYLLNTRHTSLLQQAIDSLDEVVEATELSIPVDLIQIDFTKAWDLLGEITGESVQDELLDKLFSQFCLCK